ncbi:hypothetical protein N7533_006543 [Penicillium manginii]|uniref:uncharacterized protein n=1 Tax=Penicillium manginii TaxID=203109 RepID=UPI002548A1ED|nr:uncharacterized protein N7533_006543 [Penicillium manginii]KAJ5749515.1 hypothetical protein N7533_006543 [Penicillium manginii]
MARRLSDATFQSVCNLCTGVVGRALGISGENDGNEQANPRGFREAVYDGLLAQHQTSNQPEIVLANIDEGVEEAPNNPHWDRTEEYLFKYGRLQAHGERVRQWIESPESPGCYINPSTLSIEDFEANNCYLLAPRLHAVDEDFADQISDLGFELGRTHWSFQIRAPDFAWLGDTGPGVIIMKSVDRASQDAYPISEIARALYMRDFDIDTLQHVFFQNVQNVETVPFVRRALYTEENNLSWPRKAPQTWAYGTPEYDGFLGSRIGKIVGYLVLGAYPRGTRRIIQIVTWAADPENHNRRIQIRFDIDFVPTA